MSMFHGQIWIFTRFYTFLYSTKKELIFSYLPERAEIFTKIYIFIKTGIPEILLYLLQTEISKKQLYIFAESKHQHQSFFIFLHYMVIY